MDVVRSVWSAVRSCYSNKSLPRNLHIFPLLTSITITKKYAILMQSSIAPAEQVMYEYYASGVNNVLNISIISVFMTVSETLLCGFEAGSSL